MVELVALFIAGFTSAEWLMEFAAPQQLNELADDVLKAHVNGVLDALEHIENASPPRRGSHFS